MAKKKADSRSGWQLVATLCGHARSERATDETRERAQAALQVLGPVERQAFLGRVVKQTPDLEQQMGKTKAEVDALVKSAKEKLDDAGVPE